MRIRSERIKKAKLKGTHTKKEWHELKSFFNCCVKCEGKNGLKNIEKDHIIPIYQGGSDSITNIQPFCAKCNASKGHEIIDWRKIYCQKHNITMPTMWLISESKSGLRI